MPAVPKQRRESDTLYGPGEVRVRISGRRILGGKCGCGGPVCDSRPAKKKTVISNKGKKKGAQDEKKGRFV